MHERIRLRVIRQIKAGGTLVAVRRSIAARILASTTNNALHRTDFGVGTRLFVVGGVESVRVPKRSRCVDESDGGVGGLVETQYSPQSVHE